MRPSLLILTTHFPGGRCPNWKLDEFLGLSKYFDISIQPLFAAESKVEVVNSLKSVRVLKPLMENEIFKLSKHDLYLLLSMYSWDLLVELFSNSVLFSKAKLCELLILLKKYSSIKANARAEFFKVCEQVDLIYSYWGTGAIEVLFLKNRIHLLEKTLVRLHGFDLYKVRRSSGYFPFRKRKINNLCRVLAISEMSRDYLINEFFVHPDKIEVHRLGVSGFKSRIKIREKDYLHIVSCAYIIPLKRIDLLLEVALNNPRIKWTHFGGGPELEDWKEQVTQSKSESRIHLLGDCSKHEMENLYQKGDFDLFINVSETEGVPVSVMEAMSTGLPIMATNVGGTSEIVTSENGVLLPPEISSTQLNVELEKFFQLDNKIKQEMSEASIKIFHQKCTLIKNQEKLIKAIKGLL